jgi:hypothetical protein
MNELKTYLKKVTGFNLQEQRTPDGVLKKLPLFIREGYEFLFGELYEHSIVFAKPKMIDDVTPRQLQKHVPIFESIIGYPVILVFNEMPYYLKDQLIKARMAFVVPGKQLFIPFMFMDLSEQSKIRAFRTDQFSPSAQCLLIYHLWVMSLEGKNFQDIANLFSYTPRTIGRCAEEFERAGICNIVGSKSKYLNFGMNKQETWNHALGFLRSPVKESNWLFKKPEDMENYRIAGVPALSRYSNMSSGLMDVYAMDAENFRAHKNSGMIEDTFYNVSNVRLQIWTYNPALLTKTDHVDPFSLYLTLNDDPDERVQMELETMLEKLLK